MRSIHLTQHSAKLYEVTSQNTVSIFTAVECVNVTLCGSITETKILSLLGQYKSVYSATRKEFRNTHCRQISEVSTLQQMVHLITT
jgi:hypothetical protein